MMFPTDLGEFYSHPASQIVTTIVVIAVVQLIVRESIVPIVRRVVKRHPHQSKIEEQKREDTLVSIFRTASGTVLWTLGAVIILTELHVNLSALLTGAGLVGVIVGLGAQNVIKDYLAGIYIIAENQYRVGDIVMLEGTGATGGVAGVVEEITIRITKLRDLDGNLHFVRNGLAAVITNMSFQFANVNVDLRVGYDSDIDQVEEIVNEVGAKLALDPKWQDATIEPVQFLRLDSFADSYVVVKAVGKVRPASQWDIAAQFRRRIKKAFEEHGIDIPMPQVVVHEAHKKS